MATIVKDLTLLKRGFIYFYYDFVVNPMSLKSLVAEEQMALTNSLSLCGEKPETSVKPTETTGHCCPPVTM